MRLANILKVAIPGEQIIYSLTSFVVTITCARAMTIANFGEFALFSALVLLFVGLQRALVTEPLMIASSKILSSGERKNINSAFLIFSIMISSVIAAFLCAFFYITYEWQGVIFIYPTIMLIFLNDYSRFIYIMAEKYIVLLINTLVVSVAQIGTIIYLQQKITISAEVAAFSWGGCALIGMLFHAIFLRTNLMVAWKSLSLVREHLKLGSQFAMDYFFGIATTQGVLLAATAVTGPAAAAALRGADSLVGPVRMLLQSAPALVLPRSDAIVRSQSGVIRTIVMLILGFCAIVAVWDILVLSVPDSIGAKLLGKSWVVVRPILPWILLGLFLNVVVAFSALGLKILQRGDVLAKSRLKLLPFGFVLSIGGAFYAGAQGGAIGALMTSTVAATIWFRGFLVIARTKQ